MRRKKVMIQLTPSDAEVESHINERVPPNEDLLPSISEEGHALMRLTDTRDATAQMVVRNPVLTVKRICSLALVPRAAQRANH